MFEGAFLNHIGEPPQSEGSFNVTSICAPTARLSCRNDSTPLSCTDVQNRIDAQTRNDGRTNLISASLLPNRNHATSTPGTIARNNAESGTPPFKSQRSDAFRIPATATKQGYPEANCRSGGLLICTENISATPLQSQRRSHRATANRRNTPGQEVRRSPADPVHIGRRAISAR